MKTRFLRFKKAISAALLVLLLNAVGLTNAYAENITFGDNSYTSNGLENSDSVTMNRDYSDLPTFEYNGLTYVVAPDPQSNYSSFLSYNAASSYCENLTIYGFSDWRMPTINELEMMYQYNESIGGFIQGNTTNPICYHSSTYYGSSGHYKLVWLTGQRVQDTNLENVGYATVSSGGVTSTFRCHVRPIRVHIELPTVTTYNVSYITQTSATCGGNVTDNGGGAVSERGVCWSTSPNPTISDSHTSDGWSTGSFSSYISNLNPGTQYYVRAYATNSGGTGYGNELTFTTYNYGLPTVTTNSVYNITTTTAYGGGNVLNDGGHVLTEKGICWSTSPNPTTYNSHTTSYNTFTGSYTLTMTGLFPGTQYYVRAYASNTEGTAYGEEVIFITTSPPTVTTNSVTNITPNTATCGGNVIAEGSGSVTARGVCWSTSPNPTISDNHTNNGTGTGSFTSNITGLDQGTLYYVRAYATNSEGTGYGEEMYFTTTRLLDVTTNDVTYITQTSATCGGYVTAYNGTTVTEKGVCWSTTSQTPTLSDSHTSNGTGSGSFTSNLTGLTQNTTYYIRAYATCSGGTAYGETKQFKTTKFEYRISEGGVVATSAGGYFYDSGGPNGDYSPNEHYIMTFTSNQGPGTKIRMTFTEFNTYYNDDYLVIYDGMNTSAPEIGTYSWSSSPGTVTATNSDGALTFVFISLNDYHVGYGWKAAISIVTPSYFINASANPGNGGTVSGGGYFNYGESCTLTATANSGYTFTNWTENGYVVSYNANYSFTVNGNRNMVANFVEEESDCFLVFDLMDSYGDGWNGASLNVSFSDGTPSQNLTFTTGYNASYVIAANDGANVTLSWTQGSWDSECSFKVKYEDGPQIYQYSYPNSNFTYSFQMDCSSSDNLIAFADANVKTLCVTNWDTNGDGELSYAEASVVDNLGEVFKNNYAITYFNELQYFTGLTVIGSYAFQSCNNLTSVSIPNSATSIGSYAFYACNNLTNVNIPISVSSIGSNAFAGCNSLTSITLPVYMTSIGNNAFFGCTSLSSIVIPRYVTSLGTEVFRDCPGLAQMSVNGNNTVYDSRNNCKAIIKTATNELLYGCKNTIIPNTVTSIGGAFDGCTSLTSIEIPSSVTSIGNYAFYNCTAMNTMTVLADNPPALGSGVFTNVIKSIPVYVPCGTTSAYQSASGWSEFTNIQETGCPSSSLLQVNALYYPNVNDSNSQFVKIHWGEVVTGIPDECFETGDFSLYDWQMDSSYPWSITTINPYEGVYCMKSGGSGVANVVSNMTVTIYIPASGEMSFFSKTSCENGWDWGYFYIDGIQKGGYTGFGSWSENIFDITAGMHTFQWRYTKDGSVDVGDDCFYVDQITFHRNSIPGWRTYCTSEFDNAIGNNGINTPSWAYEYPASYLGSNYAGWQITKVSLFSDNQYSAIGGNYTCSIYVGGAEPATGTLASTLTVDVPSNQNDWVDWDLTTPVIVTGNDPIWVVWTANATVSNWPAGCSTGSNNQGNWWNAGDGNGWTHHSNSVWTMRQWFTNRPLENFSVYRANCNGSSSTIIANNVTGDEFIDTGWSDLATGNYKYGVCTSGSDDIYWSNCIEKLISYQILVSANPSEGGFVAGGGTYSQGETCTLTATANEGYTFVNWTRNGTQVSTEAVFSFTVTNNVAYVANFEASTVTQTTTLAKGWNWYSTYIEQGGIDGLGQLENSIGVPDAIIQSQYDGYVKSGLRNGVVIWRGALTSINNEEMYKIGTKRVRTTTMEGQITDPANHPITINKGWNWIGFPCDHSVSVTEALSGFTPRNKDVIKGLHSYATYRNGTWVGTLNALEPGQGYMYGSGSNAPKTLVFQTGRGEATLANITPENNFYQPTEDYADNMTLTAVIELDGEELRSEDYELAAFVGDECRGSVKLMFVEPINRYVAFLTVFGNETEDLHFVLTDGAELSQSNDLIQYETDGMMGSLIEPVTLRFGTLGVSDDTRLPVHIYPNPSNGVFNIEGVGIRKVEVTNAYGQTILSEEVESDNMQINLSGKAAGAYLLRVVTDRGVTTKKLIKE